MSDKRIIESGQIYRHFKGNLYQIVTVAKHSETEEDYVVYQALYGEMGVWVRPLDMFLSEVDHDKYPQVTQKYRFELIPTIAQSPVTVSTARTSQGEVMTPHLQTQSQRSAVSEQNTAPQTANERLIMFLEFDTVKEKLEYLRLIRNDLDDRLINDIAMSMDVIVEDGDIDMRYASLCSALETMARFECTRLRN